MANDHRHHIRIPVRINVVVTDHQGFSSQGTLTDLTTIGCGISHKWPARSTGQIFTLTFTVPGRQISVRAKLMNVMRGFMMGFEFTDLAEIDELFICRYLYMRMQAMRFQRPKD